MNKGSGAKTSYRGMGSVDFFAVARSVMLVGRIEVRSNLRAMIQIKNNEDVMYENQKFREKNVTLKELLGKVVGKNKNKWNR